MPRKGKTIRWLRGRGFTGLLKGAYPFSKKGKRGKIDFVCSLTFQLWFRAVQLGFPEGEKQLNLKPSNQAHFIMVFTTDNGR